MYGPRSRRLPRESMVGSSITPPLSVSRARNGYASDIANGDKTCTDSPAHHRAGQYSASRRRMTLAAIAPRHRDGILPSIALSPRPARIASPSHAKKKIRAGVRIPGVNSHNRPGIGTHSMILAGPCPAVLKYGPRASKYDISDKLKRVSTVARARFPRLYSRSPAITRARPISPTKAGVPSHLMPQLSGDADHAT